MQWIPAAYLQSTIVKPENFFYRCMELTSDTLQKRKWGNHVLNLYSLYSSDLNRLIFTSHVIFNPIQKVINICVYAWVTNFSAPKSVWNNSCKRKKNWRYILTWSIICSCIHTYKIMKGKLCMFITRTALCFWCARIYFVSCFLNMSHCYSVGFHWSYVYCIWYVVRYVCMCHWFVTEVRLLAMSLLKCHSNCTCEQNTAKSFTESKIRLPTHVSRDYLRRRKVIVFLSVRTHTAQLVLCSWFIQVFIYGNWTKIFDLSQRNFFIKSGQQHILSLRGLAEVLSAMFSKSTNYGALQYSNLSTLLLLPLSLD